MSEEGHNYFFSMYGDEYSDGWDRIFKPAVDYLENSNELIPPELLDDLGDLGAVKTVSYYKRVLKKAMRDLYYMRIGHDEFLDIHSAYVQRQFRRAWNTAMRENCLDPRKDMTAEWEAIYQDLVVAEYEYIDRIAQEIVYAANNKEPLAPFIQRADLWANRWTDVYNRALAETGQEEWYRWVLGQTEKHCETCADRAGKIKTGAEWLADVMPQSQALECGGWRCDCRLERVGPCGGGSLYALMFANG